MRDTRLALTLRSGNAAFFGANRKGEVARILRELADKIEDGRTEGKLMDINGNSVGEWVLS